MQPIIPAGTVLLAGGSGRATSIPGAALLWPADLGGAVLSDCPPELRPELRPPRPCPGMVRYPAEPPAERTAGGAYDWQGRPTVLLEHVARYEGQDASRYVRALRNALTRCPAYHRCSPGPRWTVLEAGIAGPDSMLISLAEPVPGYDGNAIPHTTCLLVARRGRAVLVLADLGWESGDGHEPLVRALAVPALARLAALD